MKVTSNGIKAIETYAAQARKSEDKNKPAVKGGLNQGSDRVEISRAARDIKTHMDALKQSPAMREELVADIKKRVQQGTYLPSAEKIADGLIKELLLDKQV
jgi:negative regulator of flagellin synthesis FlgM